MTKFSLWTKVFFHRLDTVNWGEDVLPLDRWNISGWATWICCAMKPPDDTPETEMLFGSICKVAARSWSDAGSARVGAPNRSATVCSACSAAGAGRRGPGPRRRAG